MNEFILVTFIDIGDINFPISYSMTLISGIHRLLKQLMYTALQENLKLITTITRTWTEPDSIPQPHLIPKNTLTHTDRKNSHFAIEFKD